MADYRILWHSPTYWCVVPASPEFDLATPATHGKLIRAMSEAELWQTINWCVSNMRACYLDDHPMGAPPNTNIDVAAKLWLRDRPVFEAMVVEAVQRGLAFEPATFDYLRRFIIEPRRQRGAAIGATPPWRDPQRLREQTRFREFFKEQKAIDEEDQNPSARRTIDI